MWFGGDQSPTTQYLTVDWILSNNTKLSRGAWDFVNNCLWLVDSTGGKYLGRWWRGEPDERGMVHPTLVDTVGPGATDTIRKIHQVPLTATGWTYMVAC